MGASMGANLTVGRRGACIVLPMELYDAFYAPSHVQDNCFAIHKIPNKVVAAVVGVLGVVGGNLYLSWTLEHEADQVAARSGFARGGIHCFQRKLSRNCQMRSALNTWMIDEWGNYLGDTTHPLLTSRVERLKLLATAEPIELLVTADIDDSGTY
ncbi:hypothetical protein PF010_g8191 [Phytophthora fragariae]|uniref:Uncharacterized protein n=2 Tax=Phytophthora fragariae TaxID=53985 RepID=A0A6G0LFI1_9STRA|nr:hypothetical protein PF010_g8191 [Phytophthora fragariae]